MTKVINLPDIKDDLNVLKTDDWKIILYSINIYNRNWELKVEIDEKWDIKTNMHGLINNIVNFKRYLDSKEVKVEHDIYSRLNVWLNNTCLKTKKDCYKILEKLYYKKI